MVNILNIHPDRASVCFKNVRKLSPSTEKIVTCPEPPPPLTPIYDVRITVVPGRRGRGGSGTPQASPGTHREWVPGAGRHAGE